MPSLPRPPLTGDVHQTWPGKKWYQKPGPWCRTKARLGRRGAMLLTMGVLYVAIGLGELFRPQVHYSFTYHDQIPVWLRAALWVGPGIIAIIVSGRKRPRRDAWGWQVLYLAPFIRATSYAGSFVFWVITLGDAGTPLALLAMVIWAIPLVMVLICSGWVENPRRECE